MSNTKKVLITGVAGFVGSNLAGELLKRGYQVKGIDNLSQGFERNIKEFRNNRLFSFFKGDVRDIKIFSEAAKDVDYLIHLAAFKIPRYSNALNTLLINTEGTKNALEVSRRNGCKFVFSSTSDIYGRNPDIPFHEGSNILLGQTNVARWAYAVSKIYDEHLIYAYQDEYKLPFAIVRYFGGYGPNQNPTWWGGPQSVFIDCTLKNVPLPIHGDGKQTRSFTYISDTVEGTIRAMEEKKANGQVFNIGNTREISIKKLAEMIWKMIRPDEKVKIDFIPYKSFSNKYEDVSRRVPDISSAKTVLNFSPSIELEEGLPKTIEWQKRYLKKESS